MKSVEEISRERPFLKEQLALWSRLQPLREIKINMDEILSSTGTYDREDLIKILDLIAEILNIDKEVLDRLQELLIITGMDFRRLPNEEPPIEGITVDREMEFILYLISKPFFLHEGRRFALNGMYWEEGRCPVCNALPSVSIIGAQQKRRFYCSYCETVGYWKRIGCPRCQTEKPDDITILSLEGESDMRADICKNCKNYYKSFDTSLLNEYSYELLDLISIPIDIVVQKMGYRRGSHNPIGMKDLPL